MTEKENAFDYLVVGHYSRDITPHGIQPGGAPTFSGRLAHALGCRTAVLTSASREEALHTIFPPGIAIECVPAMQTTSFENHYSGEGGGERTQKIHSVAHLITADHLPDGWQHSHIVHLGPIAREIDPRLINQFPNRLIGLTPQGWLRRWNKAGEVHAQPFDQMERLMSRATAVVLSEADLSDPQELEQYRHWANLLVITRNRHGCTLFVQGEPPQEIPAPSVESIEPTGAGEIFAAAFFIQLWRNDGDAIGAAEFANTVAAHSTTQTDIDQKVTAWRTAASTQKLAEFGV